MGVPIGNESQDIIYTLLFADDQVLITQEYEDIEFMVRMLLEEFEKWDLKIYLEKRYFVHLDLALHQALKMMHMASKSFC